MPGDGLPPEAVTRVRMPGAQGERVNE
jgi:hypothetical protein